MHEAEIEDTPAGRVPAGDGWFILNVAEIAWTAIEGRGATCSFESPAAPSPSLGLCIRVLPPGEAPGKYHSEQGQEGFLVLHGECVAIVEGEERPMRAWDYLHCPPGTSHMTVATGDGPCAILMAGTRAPDPGLHYPVDETAARYGVSVPEATSSSAVAYAPWPPRHALPSPWNEFLAHPQDGAGEVQEDAGPPPDDGWFIVNVAGLGWETVEGGGGGTWCAFESRSAPSRMLGIGIHVLEPGDAPGFYHAESTQEGFLVLRGTCIAIVEGQERRMGPWDYLHCPPGTAHVTVGAGDRPCAILMVGVRSADRSIRYLVDAAAARYGHSVPEETTSPKVAYAGRAPIVEVPSPWPSILEG